MVTQQSVPRRNNLIRIRNYRGVLLVSGPRENYEFADSAEFIFRAINGENTVERIGTLVSEHYEVEHAEAVGDVTDFVADLLENGIVTLD